MTNDPPRDALSQILDEYDERAAELLRRAQQSGQDEFADRFDELVRDTVRPLFDGLVTQLEERGHVAEVISEPRGRDQRLRPRGASVTLAFRPRGTVCPDVVGRYDDARASRLPPPWGDAPYFRISCNTRDRSVDVGTFSGLGRTQHSGMQSSAWQLEEVTSDALRSTAVGLIGQALRPVRVSHWSVQTGISKNEVVVFSAHFDPLPEHDELWWWIRQLRRRVYGDFQHQMYTVTTTRDELEVTARELLAAVDDANAAYPESIVGWDRPHRDGRVYEQEQGPFATEQAILDRLLIEPPEPGAGSPLTAPAGPEAPPPRAAEPLGRDPYKSARKDPPEDLAEILRDYEERAAEARRQSAEDEFADRFDEVVRATVRPVLDGLASQLKERGFDAEVLSEPRSLDHFLQLRGPSIALVFRPRGTADVYAERTRPEHQPRWAWRGAFILTCKAGDQSVRVECHGGWHVVAIRHGPVRDPWLWQLEEVTSDAIRRTAVRLIGESLAAAPQR